MLRKWIDRWGRFDSVTSFAGYAWAAFVAVTGLSLSAIAAWTSSTLDWYRNTYQWAGVAFAFFAAALSFALTMFLFGFGVAAWRGSFSRQRNVTSPATKENEAGATPKIDASLLRSVGVYGGSLGHSVCPRFEAVLARSGKSLELFIDYSRFIGGGSTQGWSRIVRIRLFGLDTFTCGETVKSNVMTLGDRNAWYWGMVPGFAINEEWQVKPNCPYQARLVVRTCDDDESYCDFIMLAFEPEKEFMPQVIGEHMFNFRDRFASTP